MVRRNAEFRKQVRTTGPRFGSPVFRTRPEGPPYSVSGRRGLLVTSLRIVAGRRVANGISANAMLHISLMIMTGNQKSIGMMISWSRNVA